MAAEYPQAVGIEAIGAHTLALADLAGAEPMTTPVPTCGEWNLADLVWHLTEVQDFWSYIIGNRPAGPDDYPEPTRPADDAALPAGLRAANRALLSALADAAPGEAAWSWATDQTVGFTVRRQSHEALVHFIDGLLAAGRPLPDVTPELAADGVDEVISIYLVGVPSWATFTRTPGVVQVGTTDTSDEWTMVFGRMTGTSPNTGKTYDVDALELDDTVTADASIEASAFELDLWLWNRLPTTAVAIGGDVDVVGRLQALMAEATE